MADESDEDVVFDNSPLMQHFRDTGLDVHFETFTPANEDNRPKETTTTWLTINEVRRWLSVLLSFTINIVGLTVLKEEILSMENLYKEKLFLMAVKSKALEAEDQQFLENFTERVVKPKQPQRQPFIKSKLLMMVALPCILTYLYSRVVYPDLPWTYKTFTDLSALFTLLYILINSVKHLIVWYCKTRIETIYESIMRCFQIGEDVVKYSQKSLRLIQESELISRGFTLVSHQSPVSRLEQNSLHHTQRQCPQLRSTLFHSTRKCFLVLKSTTINLLSVHPLDADIDNIMNYLCHIPMDEFGQCLQVKDTETKQLYDITDGFSVASLKGIKHLCHLQLSEFLRRLTLTFIENDSSELRKSPEFTHLMEQLTYTLHDNNDKLQRSYDIHSCCTINQETQITRGPASVSSPLSDVHVAIHSLDLHLQAALLRIRALSTIMEHQIEKSENKTDESSENLLQQVKQELLACRGCWEEGIIRVDKLLKGNEEPEKIEVLNTDMPSLPSVPKPVIQIGLEDPVIVDEVFEAYNDDDEDESTGNTWDEFLSPEEKEKKRKEKEEALRLLTELKSVISVRAEDTAKREQIALDKVKGFQRTVKSDSSEISDLEKVEDQNKETESEGQSMIVPESVNHWTESPETIQNNEGESPKMIENNVSENRTNLEPVNNSDSELVEIIMKPRKQKYVYCPPEDEMISSTGSLTGPQFISLPVLGRHEDAEERLGRLSGANLTFTSMLAAQAIAQSQRMGCNVQTFGDDDICDYGDNGDFCDYGDRVSSDEDCRSMDSLNDGDEDCNDDSLKDNQAISSHNEFDDNDSLKDYQDDDLDDRNNQETNNCDSDDSLEVDDHNSIDERLLKDNDILSDGHLD